jgi:SAM-dependent methyltransferase
MAGTALNPSAASAIETVNPRQPNDPPLTRQHARRQLRDAEKVLLERHAAALGGVVLELSPGGSQLTEELVQRASSYTGLGPSAAVIGVCRQIYRAGTFVHSEVTDLEQFPAGGLDAVLAWRCSLDVLGLERRRTVLAEVHRVLGPAGLLIFSSHNQPDQGEAPAAENRARRGGGLLRNLRLRSSRAPMDERELGNELLSGIDGEPSAVQYRIGRDEQEAQLGEIGLRLIECVDLAGRAVPAGETAAESPELHYIATPSPS